MVDAFGEKLMHNKERKPGLNMMTFNRWLKFVNVYMFVSVYTCKCVHGPSSTNYIPNFCAVKLKSYSNTKRFFNASDELHIFLFRLYAIASNKIFMHNVFRRPIESCVMSVKCS